MTKGALDKRFKCIEYCGAPLRIFRISLRASSFPPERISTRASRSRIYGGKGINQMSDMILERRK